MSNESAAAGLVGLWAGFIIGVVFVFSFYDPLDKLPLTNCAKTHNVYQCEMVAVPKAGEK